MDKMKKTAVRLDVVFNVLQVACIVAAVASGVALVMIVACLIFRFDPELIGTGYNVLDIGALELELAEAFAPDKYRVLVIGAVDMAMSVILALLGRACTLSVRRLLAPMKEGLPFHGSAAACLRRLALLSLVIGVVLNASEIANQLLTSHICGLEGLLVGEKIVAVELHSKLRLSCLVVSGVLLLLSYVFRYGQSLQQLSDETV